MEGQKDPLAVDHITKDLDQCRDGRVAVQSCFSPIAGLAIVCSGYFVVPKDAEREEVGSAEQFLLPPWEFPQRVTMKSLCLTVSPVSGFHGQIGTLRKCTDKTPPPFDRSKESQLKPDKLLVFVLFGSCYTFNKYIPFLKRKEKKMKRIKDIKMQLRC